MTSDHPARSPSNVWRWALAGLGVLCVGLGGLGVILPVMPTTVFLVVACFLFARSIPRLEKILVRNRFFSRFLPMVDGKVRLSRIAKISAMALIWGSTAVSCTTLYFTGVIGIWPIVAVIVLNGLGSVFILRS